MKTYRIVAIVALALVAVALVTTSAYAYMGGRAATPYGTSTGVYGTYQGGVMGGRGMMGGNAYSAPTQPTVPAQPSTPTTTTPPTQYYGGMGCGMMGYYYTSTPTATMPVTVDQAKTDAQQFLNTYYAGTTVGDATTFYGHYTIEVLNAGSPSGMLSVNGYTGQVWYHTWHGTFIQEWTP